MSFTIAKDPRQVYEFVSDPENWQKFLRVIRLESRSAGRLRLVISKPRGIDFESRLGVTDHKSGDAWASDEAAWHRLLGGVPSSLCARAAHGKGFAAAYDYSKQRMQLSFDHPLALRQVIQACTKSGTVSIPGVYGGVLDKIPFGAAFGKGLILKMGQTQVHRYMQPLLKRVQNGEIDPSFVITHRWSLDEAPRAYRTFRDKQANVSTLCLTPGGKR